MNFKDQIIEVAASRSDSTLEFINKCLELNKIRINNRLKRYATRFVTKKTSTGVHYYVDYNQSIIDKINMNESESIKLINTLIDDLTHNIDFDLNPDLKNELVC